ncbi:ABC transporter substrate-binding protein [Pseudohoeflea coraliihabitans]|uniref:ABC transporter substrate-binding protein n=1 Tax=Pseudohoeflea coraliihabitans TaxID=2860393 RepID=A0ABS6WR38_9HYPH|nr:ABC transporter substrate-binding protein [Pseudohoeflea sp. DP4N28-3]MBW3098437.1 ABC transporter substrate-binding protein [Pseudohoeflea sp. DP4N28-3]
MKKFLKTTAAGVLAAGMMTGAGQAQEETLKVGGIFSVSGPAAPFGVPERDIVKILADNLNSEGGIDGKKIEIIFCDDQTNPTESARCATKLIRQDGVIAIIGSTIGTGTLALMPVAARAEVPVLAPVGTISVTDKEHAFWPWVFRIAPTDKVILSGIMERGVFSPGHKKFAVMYQEDAYGEAGMEYATKLSEEQDIEVVAALSAPLSAIDLTAQATKIRNADPDVILLQTSAPALGAAFVRAAKQVGIEAPIIGSGSLNQQPFINAAGDAGEGVQVVSMGNWNDPSDKQKALGDVMQAAGMEPQGYGELLSSTGFMALAEAIRRVDGEVTGAKIRDALETICDFDGTYIDGKLCYSPEQHEGVFEDSLITVEIRDGAFVTIN